MADYIDREKLIKAIENDACELVFYGKPEAISCIEAAPAADVRPVVRGRWEHGAGRIIATCTVCGFTRNLNENFGAAIACPNCGADMRGE